MTPIEAMAKAMRGVPDFWMRVNKLRDDGRFFEVGHNPDPELVDPVVVAAFSDHGEATAEVGRLTWEARARAALLALAEVELPKGVSQAGGFAMDGLDEKAELAFRAMLRSIAQGDA